ncbi:thioredoxin family protein [Nannocystis punicea]|uniref:Thioredoxin family protein n=1 Tax=Nannocystis punicea TaxID=2995304 RepID=A0ABY7H986_9BACT|nr:thioredoxin family protein [Nannocystis poenicansa]WAS95827.1 thioredoxin family protein [Nannocystis poenicansa]
MRPSSIVMGRLCSLAFAVLALAGCAGHPGSSTVRPDEPPQTRAQFEEVQQRAAAEQRVLLVVTVGTTCEPCEQLRRNVLRDAAVVEWFGRRGAVFVVDVSRDVALREALGLDAAPVLVAYRDGQEFERSAGNRRPEELLLWLQDVDEGRTSLGRLSQMLVYAGRERDAGLRFDYAQALIRARAYDEAARELAWLDDHLDELDGREAVPESTLRSAMAEVEHAAPSTSTIFASRRRLERR